MDRPKALPGQIAESTGLKYVFTFGKFKGDELQDVIESDPEYISWVMENVPDFTLSNEAYALWGRCTE